MNGSVQSSGAGSSLRAGFTLWETSLVLAILAITLILAAPAMVDFGRVRPPTIATSLLKLLHDARQLAVQGNTVVLLRLDPTTGRFQIDTTGVTGSGAFATGSLELEASSTLETDQLRLQYLFRPGGAAFGDTVRVHAPDGVVLVSVDPWSGVARADPR